QASVLSRALPPSHGIGRYNGDAVHADTRSRFAHLAAIALSHRRVADLAEHVVTFEQPAKGSVLAVEKFGIAQANKKLTPGRIRVLRAGHREDAAHVRLVVELGLDLITWTARPPAACHRRVFG